ncbi:unnamed protein product [Closterium sp. Yama58-4]|nr:unnamed protein product [Closterium sp. Yama58-4]
MAAAPLAAAETVASPVALFALDSRRLLIPYKCVTLLPRKAPLSHTYSIVAMPRYSHFSGAGYPSTKALRFHVSASGSDVDGPSQRVGSRRRGRPRKNKFPEDETSRESSAGSESSLSVPKSGDEVSWSESSDEFSGSDGEGSGFQRALAVPEDSFDQSGFVNSREQFEEASVEIVTVSGRASEDDSGEIVTVSDVFSSSDDNNEGSDVDRQDYDEGSAEADWSNGNEDQPSGSAAGGSRAVGGLPPPTWRQNLPPSPPPAPAGPSQVVCVGEAVREFVPVVRRSSRQAPDEIFATWRNLQWVPPDFARAPGGPACQVAVALARLNADVAFVGAVGDDEAGQAFLEILDANGVSTRGVEMQAGLRTGAKLISLEKAQAQENYEESTAREELELREGEVLRGGVVIKKSSSGSSKSAGTAWRVGFPLAEEARDVAGREEEEGENEEDEEEEERKESREGRGDGERRVKGLAVAAAASGGGVSEDAKDVLRQASWIHCTSMSLATPSDRTALLAAGEREEGEGEGVYHWKPEELAGLWHDGMELLLVTHGTMQVHYYGRGFHGWVEGTEDVLIAAMTCDRAGSGDALVAGLLRKLSTNPSILSDPDALERAIRFAISAGVISSWTTGAVRSFPSEEAAQNLTEQMLRLGPNLGTPLKPSSSKPLRARPRSSVIVRAATDLYQTLGVPYTANKQEIKKAFREMARKYHPDVSHASGSGRAFQAIVTAYEVLSDDQQRRLYDLSIQRAATSSRAAAASRAAGSRAAASRGATVARGAFVRVAGVPTRSSARHWSSVSSATSAHGSSVSFDPFDRAFSASVRPSAEPGPGSARASSSECPIFSAWYLRWLFHARWALAVQQRARRAAEFKRRGGAWQAAEFETRRGMSSRIHEEQEEQRHAGQDAGMSRRRRPEQGGSHPLVEQGGLLEADAYNSGWVAAAAASAAAAADTGGAVAAAAAGSSGGAEQEATLQGEKYFGGSRQLRGEPRLHHAPASPASSPESAAAAGGSAQHSKASTLPLASHARLFLSFLCHAPSSLLHILLSPLQPEWRASFGSDLVFILVSVILGVLYGTNATVAWLSLVLILSANTRLGLKVAAAVAWRLGGMPGLWIGVGLHALSFLLGIVHHEAVGALAFVVWMGRQIGQGMGQGMGGGMALAPAILVVGAAGIRAVRAILAINPSKQGFGCAESIFESTQKSTQSEQAGCLVRLSFSRSERGQPRHRKVGSRAVMREFEQRIWKMLDGERRKIVEKEITVQHLENERRERLVKASRDVTIQSKKIIFAIHRATTPHALAAEAQQLAALRTHHIAQVARELQAVDYWRFTRAYTWGVGGGGMGWDGMGWDGMGWDGMGWDVVELDG